MSNIYGILERESRTVTLGDSNKLECGILVGSANKSEEFVDVVVTKNEKDFEATIRVHGQKEFMLCAEKYDDIVMVKSMVLELKDWLEEVDYEEIFGVLEELEGLKATLSSYLEDIYRIEE
ncbi:hypothetical protein KAX02_08165 [candidate division WOR-3 bacterium]|nr:hypothetical protein [candidate division WOR-3 bacterium]